jgi:hypothetical protein
MLKIIGFRALAVILHEVGSTTFRLRNPSLPRRKIIVAYGRGAVRLGAEKLSMES